MHAHDVLDGTGGPHAFVDDLDAPTLADADRHHLARVRRLRDGDPLTVGDGHGRWRACRFGAHLDAVGEIQVQAAPHPPVGVAFALVKGARPELVTQKLTELGVDRIVPFTAERSVVRWDERRRTANLAKLTTVAREAAMQSRRAWLPTVEPLTTFDDVAGRDGAVLAHRDGELLGLATGFDVPGRLVLIGPEGGWSDGELAADLAHVRLSDQVLRAETAAIAAGVLLCVVRTQPGASPTSERPSMQAPEPGGKS